MGGRHLTLHADVNRAKVDFDENIVRIMSEIDGSEATIAFSDSDNFRFDVFSQYKANRKKNRKPLGIRDVREWVMQNYPYLVMPRLEADDVFGIIAASPGAYIAVSGDKDFNTIPEPGTNHLTKELKTVTEEADRFFLRQVLTGCSRRV